MSAATLICERRPGELRCAWLAGGRPRSLLFRRDHWLWPGDVHLGRVTGVAPDGGGAFIDLGAGGAGFLKAAGRKSLPAQGALVPVTITAHDPAAVGKAARLAAGVLLEGRYLRLRDAGRGLRWPNEARGDDRAAWRETLERALAPIAAEMELQVQPAALPVACEAVIGEAKRLVETMRAVAEEIRGGRARRVHRPPWLVQALAAGPPGALRLHLDMPPSVRAAALRLAADYPEVTPAGDEPAGMLAAAGVDDHLEAVAAGCLPIPGGGSLRLGLAPSGVVVDVDAGALSARGDRRRLFADLARAAAESFARNAALLRLQGLVLIDLPVAGPAELRRQAARVWRAACADAGLGRDIAGPNRHGVVSIAIARSDTPVPAFLDMPGLSGRLRREARLFAALRHLDRAVAAAPGEPVLRVRLDAPLAALMEELRLKEQWERWLNLPLVVEAAG